MEYTTRMGTAERRAHVNYQCPCSCIGGVIYDSNKPLTKPGSCCCGRLLMVGADARARLEALVPDGARYEFDVGSVTLPWGEVVEAALAVPGDWEKVRGASPVPKSEAPAKAKDPVCGMLIDPAAAAGQSEYRGATYYFCAVACKTRFDADPARFVAA